MKKMHIKIILLLVSVCALAFAWRRNEYIYRDPLEVVKDYREHYQPHTHNVSQQEPSVKPDTEILDILLKKYPPIDKERADIFGLVKLKMEYEEAIFSKSPKAARKKSAYQQEIRHFHIKKDKYLAYILAEQEVSLYPDSVVLPFRFKHPLLSTIGPCTFLYYQDILTTVQYNLLHGDPDSLLCCRPEILEKPLHYRDN